MHEVVRFSEDHIQEALELWSNTAHLGVGDSDTVGDLSRFLSRHGDFSFIVKPESELMGTVLAGHDERRGYIYHLATSGPARREGIASLLLDTSLEHLKSAGIKKCHAFVFRSNPYAELFWSRLGWERRDDLYVFSKVLS